MRLVEALDEAPLGSWMDAEAVLELETMKEDTVFQLEMILLDPFFDVKKRHLFSLLISKKSYGLLFFIWRWCLQHMLVAKNIVTDFSGDRSAHPERWLRCRTCGSRLITVGCHARSFFSRDGAQVEKIKIKGGCELNVSFGFIWFVLSFFVFHPSQLP